MAKHAVLGTSRVFVDNNCSTQSSDDAPRARPPCPCMSLKTEIRSIYRESKYTVAAASERAAAKETVDRARHSHLLVAFDSSSAGLRVLSVSY